MLSYANFKPSIQLALSLLIELTLAIVFSASLWVNYMLYIMMVNTTFKNKSFSEFLYRGIKFFNI